MQTIKNLGVFSSKLIFFIITLLRGVKKSVYISIYFALIVGDLKMIPKKLLGLADLIRAQALCFHKSTKVVMISQDKDFILVTF